MRATCPAQTNDGRKEEIKKGRRNERLNKEQKEVCGEIEKEKWKK
jgi:hypothetical protein